MTKHGVGLTQGEREGLLARASRGGGGAAETRRANLLLAVDQGGFADLRTAGREAAMACRSTARTARDPKGRLVEGGSTACSRARRAGGRETPGQAARPRRGSSPRPARVRQGATPGGRLGPSPRGAWGSTTSSPYRTSPSATCQEKRASPMATRGMARPGAPRGLVAATGDVPRACERPRDPRHPPACPGEPSRQLVAHAREALPARPGSAEGWDHGYVRNGVADVSMALAPLECERHALLTRARTRVDLAETPRWVSGDLLPEAEGIVLVWDNPNTHSMGSPCEAFPPGEAERLASRLEARHAPRHGSWPGMAETGVGCPVRHGLPARVGSLDEMGRLTAAWEADRNARARTVEWRLAVDDARERLAHLYPKTELEEKEK